MDINEIKQSGGLFVDVSSEMREMIPILLSELESSLCEPGFRILVDSVPMNVIKTVELKEELEKSLLTGKIGVDLLPKELVEGSSKWLKLYEMILAVAQQEINVLLDNLTTEIEKTMCLIDESVRALQDRKKKIVAEAKELMQQAVEVKI